jgi:DNA invertase Pin-like site-specific DNA recombinase
MNKVAGYFRVSRARDGMHAPDIYREQIQRYCTYRSLNLSETYSDIDFSGYRNSEKRPRS